MVAFRGGKRVVMYIGVVKIQSSMVDVARIRHPGITTARYTWAKAMQDAIDLVDYYTTSYNSVSWDVIDLTTNELTR
jgi:hypothetical protein